MRKILILGAGNAQIDLIEYCKENGYIVYGCSYTNTDKGIPLLDYFEQINITDIEKVKEYAENIQADIIYSVGSDIAMPTVSRVCELLHLPHFVSYNTALTCNTKDNMRKTLGETFEGNVPYIVIRQKEDLEKINFFPVIMKPVDSQGQRGVYQAGSLQELIDNYDKSIIHSRKKQLIIEKYLDGREISVNAFFEKGNMRFSIVSDRISFSEYPGGIIKKHILPSGLCKDICERACALARRTASRLSISNGPAYFQMKVVEGIPYLIEAAPRLDGCHMWKFIKYYCGVDLLKASVNLLESTPSSAMNPVCRKGNFALEFICQKPGTPMREWNTDEIDYRRDYYDTGEEVRRLNGYMEKCGYMIYQEK